MGIYWFDYLRLLLWPAIIIGLIIYSGYWVMKKRGGRGKASHLIREDIVSQLLFCLALLFFGTTLFVLNRNAGTFFTKTTILLVSALIGMAVSYGLKLVYPVAICLVGFLVWWPCQVYNLMPPGEKPKGVVILAGLCFMGLLFFSLSRVHDKNRKFRRYAAVYFGIGFSWLTAVLFILSTEIGLKGLEELTKEGRPLFVFPVLVSLAAAGLAGYAFANKLMPVYESAAVWGLTILFWIIALLPRQVFFSDRFLLAGPGVLWAVIFNLALVAVLLGLIMSGYRRGEKLAVNAGAFLFFLLIIIKYTDWFFTFLDKGVFFILAGILLFVVGRFMEKSRRRLLASMKTEPGASD